MKRTLSLVLSLIMILGIFASMPVSVNAVGASDLTFTLNDDGISYSITDCNESVIGEIVIPETYNGLPVTMVTGYSLGDYYYGAFSKCTGLTSIRIPNTVKKIGNYAFYYCENLSSIIIPDGVISIGSYSFEGCTSLASVTIPDSVTSINEYAFRGCSSLSSIIIPSSLIKIDDYVFWECDGLTSITILDNISTIGTYAFCGCENLTSITISNSVTKINFGAFRSCAKLKDVYFYGSKNEWEKIVVDSYNEDLINATIHCLYDNPNYAALTFTLNSDGVSYSVSDCDTNTTGDFLIPSTYKGLPVTRIGDAAFVHCTNLTSITIPVSVTKIGETVFNDSINLTAIHVDEDNENYCSVDGVLFNKNKTTLILYPSGKANTSYTIPSTVTYVYDFSFMGCNNLISIVIPDSVTSIGWNTFFDCDNLTTVTLSNSIIGFNEGSFWGCNKLASVICTDCSFDIESKNFVMGGGGSLLSAEWTYADHTPSNWFNFAEATCTTNGANHIECIECKKVLETETIPALGHTSTNWIIDSQATINAPGKKHKECTTCGEVIETATITQLKPSTPKVTTTNEIGGVNVTWNKVDGAVKYNVYRRQGGYSTWTLVGTTTGNTLLDKNVKSGIYYVYSVRAYNVSGGYSDFVSANTNTRKYMDVPKLTGISNATNGLYIKWNPVSGVTNGYRVYRRGAGSVHWYYLGTVKTNYFTDTTIKNNSGEYYRYTVIADGGYHSKFDTTGLYLKRLANPTLTSAVSSKSGITVKWASVKTATDYYVYRKTANSGWVRIATLPGNSTTTYLDKTAKKGTTYTYTVRACSGSTISYFNSGISCYDKY